MNFDFASNHDFIATPIIFFHKSFTAELDGSSIENHGENHLK